MVEHLQPGASLSVECCDKASTHLDVMRLECLKLASADADVRERRVTMTVMAAELLAFVTEGLERPALFAVRRLDDAEPGDHPILGPLNYFAFDGQAMRWGHEHSAYRFRSKREAQAAITKYGDHLGGQMCPVPLPSYLDLF